MGWFWDYSFFWFFLALNFYVFYNTESTEESSHAFMIKAMLGVMWWDLLSVKSKLRRLFPEEK